MKDCLKDVNFTNHSKDNHFLRFQRDDMRTICQQILQDIIFLNAHNLIDYSLLLITEKNPDYNEDDENFTNVAMMEKLAQSSPVGKISEEIPLKK